MRFLADESVDRQIVERVRQDEHEVSYVAEMAPGLSDDAILDQAKRERLLLLTADKDFGELVFRQRRATGGIVLIRLAGLSPNEKAELVISAIQQRGSELPGAFVVVAPGLIRIRRSAP